MIIKSDRIYFEDGLKSGYLVIADGKFSRLLDEASGKNYIDYGCNRIIPGIFDTHNHGTCGYSLMGVDGYENKIRNVKGFLKGCASQGITNVFPTAALDMIEAVADVSQKPVDGAEIVGIHSEGPWLNRTGEKGVRTGWPEVSIDTAKEMVARAHGLLKLVSLAPEIPGIDKIIDYLLSQGITVALAHSDCKYEEAMAAYRKGLSVSTHTGNVMVGMHHRNVGGLGAALLNDKVDCEVICDGMHVCLEMLKIYFKVKSTSHFMMISDCTPFSEARAGCYNIPGNNTKINVTKDGFILTDTGRLFGSSKPVLFGISNLVEKLGMPMETVLKMSSLNPCKKYGLSKTKGSIKIGKDANFAVISDDYKTLATFVKGHKVYDRATDGVIFNPNFYNLFD